ncbi:hypothetical protein PoB_004284900 [Plakobranchus ocellatus]|uniref:Uncharacterized protein n=1 Tax=Plakobranchus ocellatus TaxID=259542 RepID=A0AAV4BC61_9GAST|nr:hypothetical protein PoB_004284900 [Plakobranchus ocellatus]
MVEDKRNKGRRRIAFIESLNSWAIGNDGNIRLIRFTGDRLERRTVIAYAFTPQGTYRKKRISLYSMHDVHFGFLTILTINSPGSWITALCTCSIYMMTGITLPCTTGIAGV